MNIKASFSRSMVFDIILLFVFKSIDCVVDSEDVFRVKLVFNVLLELERHRRQDPRHKSFSEFTDAVVVRQTASLLQDLVSAFVLDIVIHLDDLVRRDVCVCVVVAEVDVHGGTCLVKLGNTER